MTEFLIRSFVRNYNDIQDSEVRTRYGILSSVVGIFCNVLLFAGKLLIGFFLHSISVMADAFNNLSDAAASVISFVGVKMADKPADDEHPFGHGRVEYIAAFIVAFLVIQVGFTFFKSSIGKIWEPQQLTFQLAPFLALIASVAVKLWMGLFNRKLGKRINSKVMLATAADSLGDVLTTGVTILSILIFCLFGVNVDAYAGIIVSLIVMWAGVGIAKDTLEPLIGEAIDPELYNGIKERVESYDGIEGTHDLIVHNYGPNRSMASIHAEISRELDLEEAHEMIDRIEREISRELGILLVIHMDPVEVHDAHVLHVRHQLTGLIRELDERLDIHDFRMAEDDDHINLIFDLVVPYEYREQEQDDLRLRIMEKVQAIDPRCQCVITLDKSYVHSEG